MRNPLKSCIESSGSFGSKLAICSQCVGQEAIVMEALRDAKLMGRCFVTLITDKMVFVKVA